MSKKRPKHNYPANPVRSAAGLALITAVPSISYTVQDEKVVVGIITAAIVLLLGDARWQHQRPS